MKLNKFKKIAGLSLAAIMTVGTATALTGCGKKAGANDFTWFISESDNSTYGYTEYEGNAAVQYVLSKEWADKDGNGQKLSVDFNAPPTTDAGTETFQRMMSTQSETDIFDSTFSTDGILSLYQQGIIMDVTELVENNMPNYLAMLEKYDIYNQATYAIEGKEGRRFLGVGGYSESSIDSLFCGWCYRRDWVVKYGKDPSTGASFSGSCTEEGNYDTWTDNVKFPSWYNNDLKTYVLENVDADWNGGDPIFISDWEWLLDVLASAQKGEGINDKYVMSLYYPGYNENGDLVSSFGGGCPAWYKSEKADGTYECQFGASTENFKTYLQCMNNWYKKGWIDKNFTSRKESFYQIDDSSVRNGEIGLWCGLASTLSGNLQKDELPKTRGSVVYGARNPINDVYGGDAQKMKIPDTFFGPTPFSGGGVCFAKKSQNSKNWDSLFKMLDYFYSDEGMLIYSLGLNKEQLNEAPTSVKNWYNNQGLSEGAYTVETEGTETFYRVNRALDIDSDLGAACRTKRMGLGFECNSKIRHNYGESLVHSKEEWLAYEPKSFIGPIERSLMTPAENKKYSAQRSAILLEFMEVEVPKFIKGTYSIDGKWNEFVKGLQNRGYEEVNAIFTRIFNS